MNLILVFNKNSPRAHTESELDVLGIHSFKRKNWKKNYFSSYKLPKQQLTGFWSRGILGVKFKPTMRACSGPILCDGVEMLYDCTWRNCVPRIWDVILICQCNKGTKQTRSLLRKVHLIWFLNFNPLKFLDYVKEKNTPKLPLLV
jgi:hypothetical protein